jgi:hypothetical protein
MLRPRIIGPLPTGGAHISSLSGVGSKSIRCFRIALAMLVVPSLLHAQTRVVSPYQFATIEGSSGNTHPLGPTLTTSPSMRYLAVHDDLKGVPGVIKGMGMRLNAGSTGVATDITMEVVISTAITTSATIDATFDNNHGTDKATVVPANSLFQFAAYPAVTRGPAPFTYQVPFNNPFPFVGAGPICW